MTCSCGRPTESIDGVCQSCLERLVRESRLAQGLPPKTTDPAVLASVASLFASAAGDLGGAAIGTPVAETGGGQGVRAEAPELHGVSGAPALASVPPAIDTSRHPSGWKGEEEHKATTPSDAPDEVAITPAAG